MTAQKLILVLVVYTECECPGHTIKNSREQLDRGSEMKQWERIIEIPQRPLAFPRWLAGLRSCWRASEGTDNVKVHHHHSVMSRTPIVPKRGSGAENPVVEIHTGAVLEQEFTVASQVLLHVGRERDMRPSGGFATRLTVGAHAVIASEPEVFVHHGNRAMSTHPCGEQ